MHGRDKNGSCDGASSGIGLELVREFVEHGYDLVVAAADTAIHDVPNRLVEYGAAVQAIQVGLRSPDAVQHLYDTAIEG